MADLFGDFKRPNAEKKVIEKFIKLYEKSKKLFKNKNYIEALENLNIGYQLLLDIWDQYPKIITLYLMMKGYFYSKQYNKCKQVLETLDSMLEYIQKDKKDIFIKIKAKILLYQLILYFIYDDIDNSVDSIIGWIRYLSNHPTFSLEDKASFFWHYIKSFLKITGITKSNKFLLLQEGYNSMIVEQVNLNNNENENNIPVKKVNKYMVEIYKNFMNSKLRGIIYELLDKEFYFMKYRKRDDKVMLFLHKNINIFVRDNNRERLVKLFHTFLVLNKTNLKKEFNMTLDELVFEQKRRIEAFDRIFSNLVGAFNHIFRTYYAEELPNISKKMRKNSGVKNFKININELKNLIKIKIQSPGKDEEKVNEKPKNKFSKVKKVLFDKKILKKGKEDESSNSFNFSKDIIIPPINEEMDKQILIDNYFHRRNLFKNEIKNNKKNKNENSINNITSIKNQFLKLPDIYDNNYYLKTERNEKSIKNNNNKNNKALSHRDYYLKQNKKRDTETTDLNISNIITKKNNIFQIRNINNYLITQILDNFLSLYNIEHAIPTDKTIDLSLVYPRKTDLFDFNIKNYIHSYGSVSIKGTKPENQDDYFFYDNYFLIKNLSLFGVCDGHGKYGQEIAQLVCTLFPSYLFYILLDDNLIERKFDINTKILKLIKAKENPDEVKNMFLLRYFFNKFEIDFSYIPLFSGNQKIFFNQIHESLYYSHKELSHRYNIEIDNSGTTLCSGIIYGKILYIINLGDSRAVLGTYFNRSNKWKTKQLSIDHKPINPNENKRIISYNGRVERFKNEFGEEYGVYRVVGKDNDSTYPGLAISRSIGDEDAKKLGVVYEPELFKYELGERDKILVIGSDGLWENLTNEEVINIVGNCYLNDITSEEAASKIIEKIKQKCIIKNKNEKRKSSPISSKRKNKNILNDKNKETKEEIQKSLDNITCIVIYLDIK